MTLSEQYYELSYYTLAHEGKNFIHQHIVDAYTAQTADETTKPITLFFSLAGLFLFIEKSYTGKQAQEAHVQMTKKTKDYPKLRLPENRGAITIADVLEAAPGDQRDAMIHQWCISVWQAYASHHQHVSSLTEKLLSQY